MPIQPRAAVFDLDGTLVDNMAFHGRAWVATAERLGVQATRDQFEREWAGKTSPEIFEILLGGPQPAAVAAKLAAEKEAAYRELYLPHLAPLPGLFPFLARLRSAGVRVALATAAPAENRDFILGALGLERAFEVVQGPEGVARGKPAPDIYLSAAARLGLEGGACVAFEDAVNGVRAARAAGMAVVAVLTTAAEADLRAAGASFAIRDYASLPGELERYLFDLGP
ncbi:MAG TPA: HAD family phosphatase [Anaeromyxobacteraceae bacterium]|nr:HAD family phosphatase [Anaeromyxobacteraceae bacterium]